MTTCCAAIKPSSYSFYNLEGEHVARYVWAAKHVTKEMDLLDLGCGYGYGTDFLAASAKSVIGVDTDRRSISFATRHYKRDHLEFLLIRDPSELSVASFDLVIALEVIEHVAYHLHEYYPKEIHALLTVSFEQVAAYAQVSPGSVDVLIEVVSRSKIPDILRRLTPSRLKVAYLRQRGIPDSRGKWRDYPIVPCEFIDGTFPVQAYRCIKHNNTGSSVLH
jgi:SAM-dependent methyltransferase